MSGSGLIAFVKESNAIESIHRPPLNDEVIAHEVFLARSSIDVIDLVGFVHAVAPGKRLRDRPGRNVYITDSARVIPPGGSAISRALDDLLHAVNAGRVGAHETHVAYEHLHPFEDGNGRSGRVLWAWMMTRGGNDPFELPFLQRFYYQTLDAA